MRVKLFTKAVMWKPSGVQDLEAEINSWLETHPDVVIEHVHHLSHPSFGWAPGHGTV